MYFLCPINVAKVLQLIILTLNSILLTVNWESFSDKLQKILNTITNASSVRCRKTSYAIHTLPF